MCFFRWCFYGFLAGEITSCSPPYIWGNILFTSSPHQTSKSKIYQANPDIFRGLSDQTSPHTPAGAMTSAEDSTAAYRRTQIFPGGEGWVGCLCDDTADGRNPKQPPHMFETLQIMRYLPYQLVQDFFHQQYFTPVNPTNHPSFGWEVVFTSLHDVNAKVSEAKAWYSRFFGCICTIRRWGEPHWHWVTKNFRYLKWRVSWTLFFGYFGGGFSLI